MLKVRCDFYCQGCGEHYDSRRVGYTLLCLECGTENPPNDSVFSPENLKEALEENRKDIQLLKEARRKMND